MKIKNSSKRVLYLSCMNSKSLVNHFVWNHQYFKKIAKEKEKFWDAPNMLPSLKFKCTHLPQSSSGHSLLNLKMPFKLILRRFEVIFWCLEWECCTFYKIDESSFKSTNTRFWGAVMSMGIFCDSPHPHPHLMLILIEASRYCRPWK